MKQSAQASDMPEQSSDVNAESKAHNVELTVVDGEKSADAKGVRTVKFGQLSSESVAGDQAPIDLLMDVALDLSVELGRTSIPVRDVLKIAQGSIIELDKLAGEPVDVLVNGKLIARGEVVVVDDNFGVRITEIISRSELS
jgi:flagellar motor switch protein FliN/FliY